MASAVFFHHDCALKLPHESLQINNQTIESEALLLYSALVNFTLFNFNPAAGTGGVRPAMRAR